MKLLLWLAGGGGALLAGWLVHRYERMRVARGNLLGAKAMVRTARPIFWHHLGRFLLTAAIVTAAVLACVYLSSTGRQS